jgi:uncharacterized membrane protein YdjX (TVP38/TMEM64 family)
MSPLWRVIAPPQWDRMLHCCGAAAAVCIGVYLLAPSAADLVAFVAIMFVTNGPTGTFLPSASEPILLAYGKLYSPFLLACVGSAGVALAEWVNYRLFDVVLHARQLESVRASRITKRVTAWYRVSPAGTVALCALTPIPFVIARACSVLTGYPFGRHLAATVVGRFPRMWLVALAGTAMPFHPAQMMLAGLVVALMGATAAWHARSGRRLIAQPLPSPVPVVTGR